jgi:hypothetical protein
MACAVGALVPSHTIAAAKQAADMYTNLLLINDSLRELNDCPKRPDLDRVNRGAIIGEWRGGLQAFFKTCRPLDVERQYFGSDRKGYNVRL